MARPTEAPSQRADAKSAAICIPTRTPLTIWAARIACEAPADPNTPLSALSPIDTTNASNQSIGPSEESGSSPQVPDGSAKLVGAFQTYPYRFAPPPANPIGSSVRNRCREGLE